MTPEEAFHRQAADYLTAVLDPVVWWTTFPAGGGGKVRGARLKAMGLKAGVPDILMTWLDGDDMAAIGIELKAGGGSLSKAQKDMHMEMRQKGWGVFVCRSVEAVDDALTYCRVPRRGRLA